MKKAALLLAVAALAVTAAPASAKSGTFAGSLGIKVPKGADANVRAINRATGAVAAGRSVGRNGRFSLSLAPGTYLVVGTVVTKQGKVLQKRVGVSLKSGQKRKGASLKARKRKRKKPRSRSAFVQESGKVTPGRIAVEIPDVTGSVGDRDWDTARPGINDLILNDVLNGRPDCGTTIIEVDRREEVLKQLEFENSRYVDPASRPGRNLILGDVVMRGSIAPAPGGNAKVTMTIVDKHSGKQLGPRREATLDRDDWAGSIEKFSKQLADDLCKLSDVYEVTLDVAGEGRFATHSATGAIHTTLQARRNDPGRQVWRATGPLQWGGVSFSPFTDCAMVDYVVPTINWTVTILDAGEGQLVVTWSRDGNEGATASVDCPGDPYDPPPIPGMVGLALLNTAPEAFYVPHAGGVQAVSSGFSDGGDGWFNTATITVTPAGVG